MAPRSFGVRVDEIFGRITRTAGKFTFCFTRELVGNMTKNCEKCVGICSTYYYCINACICINVTEKAKFN